ncbi:MAG: hypothetical protein QXX19_08150 [Candidatus Caldarchaeum sp.]
MVLYLVVLQFRSPPWAARHKVPNILEGTYIPFDGPLSFAVYYLNNLRSTADWRFQYLQDTLMGAIKPMPSEFQASYMLPAQQENASKLGFWTPCETRVTIQLQGTQASLLHVIPSPAPQVPLSIKINKRNDLERVLSWRELSEVSLSRDHRGAIKDRGNIDSGRGPYRNVALSIEIKRSHLLWVSIIKAKNKTLLEDSLHILEQFGIGKKRHAGWGDLQRFALYNLQNSSQSIPWLDWEKLIYATGNRAYLETLRPLSTSDVSQIIRSGYLPLDIKLGQGADQPPYWRKETIVEHAKLLRR